MAMGDAAPTLARVPLPSPQRRAELMRMVAPTFYTADMVRALPDDGRRYETVHGELLVTPAPRPWHQVVVGRLSGLLNGYCDLVKVGHVFHSPADISWGADTMVQPDVFVVDLAEARTLDWSRMRHLLLAVEVLSPSSTRADRFTKRRLYQEVRVPLYWVIDPDRREVEVWTPDAVFPTTEGGRLTWRPAGAAEEFVLGLGDLLRPI
jgi:Uma2 family endonuclease